MTAPPVEALASFGQRMVAFLIDTVVFWLAVAMLMVVAAAVSPEPEYYDEETTGEVIAGWMVLAPFFGYPVFFEGRAAGQTFGKRTVGIRVVRLADGAPLGYDLALGRLLARALDLGIVGPIVALFDARRQTIHDMVAGTVVVREAVYPAVSWPGPGSWSGRPRPS